MDTISRENKSKLPIGGVIVGVADSSRFLEEAFRWTPGTGMRGLGALPTTLAFPASGALGVSGDGSIVVGWSYGDDGEEAFYWDQAGGIRTLNSELIARGLAASIAGWELTRATAISANGRVVVGFGSNAQGWVEAFRVKDEDRIPCPTCGRGIMTVSEHAIH